MKKWIIAVACILTFSGIAAAQSTTAKTTPANTTTTTKKGTEAPPKKGTTKKAESIEATVKLAAPKLNDNDSLAIPKPKDH